MTKGKEVTMVYGTKITSNQNTKEKVIYGQKHGSSAMTGMKKTLMQHSPGGSSKRKNDNLTKMCQESMQHASTSHIIFNLKEVRELREEKKQVNTVNMNVEMKKKGRKKKTNSTLRKREENSIQEVTITPNTNTKRKFMEEEIHQQKKRKTEEIVKVTMGENQKETWTNLIQSIAEHLKTCNEETGIKPMKFQVMHSFEISDKSKMKIASKSVNSNTKLTKTKITFVNSSLL